MAVKTAQGLGSGYGNSGLGEIRIWLKTQSRVLSSCPRQGVAGQQGCCAQPGLFQLYLSSLVGMVIFYCNVHGNESRNRAGDGRLAPPSAVSSS